RPRGTDGTSSMHSAQSTELQSLLDRLRAGDDSARQELVLHAYSKLHGLAATILSENFPDLKKAPACQNTSDVTNEVVAVLLKTLEEVQPTTVLHFLRLAAQRMRWFLLDMARKYNAAQCKQEALNDDVQFPWPARSADSDTARPPSVTARLHEQVERLPPEE